MNDKSSRACSATEQQFLEALRQPPQLQTRFQSILALTRNAAGPVKTADAAEQQLIAELRQLGHESMNPWAAQAGQRVSTELRAQDASVRSRKKKTLTWWCVFGLVSVRERVWRSAQQRYAPLRQPGKQLGLAKPVPNVQFFAEFDRRHYELQIRSGCPPCLVVPRVRRADGRAGG